MDSLIFELQIVFYFQLFLSANVRHNLGSVFSLLNFMSQITAFIVSYIFSLIFTQFIYHCIIVIFRFAIILTYSLFVN